MGRFQPYSQWGPVRDEPRGNLHQNQIRLGQAIGQNLRLSRQIDHSVGYLDRASPEFPAEPQPQTYNCWDGSITYDPASCPAEPQPVRYNDCGPSNVAIFNVPGDKAPKQIKRLGTLPEFGDSHDLTPSQFYDKLQQRYQSRDVDRAYLDYLFESMGYSNERVAAPPSS